MKNMRYKRMIRLLSFSLLAVTIAAHADEPKLPAEEIVGRIETVATFAGPMPTGVTVSREGRIFVNFPRWGDPVEFTVAELKDGKPIPYPDADFNRLNKDRPTDSLVSVQSVVVDPDDRLWLLDTGSTEFGPILPDGPKLVGIDLKTNKVFQTIRFPRDVALERRVAQRIVQLGGEPNLSPEGLLTRSHSEYVEGKSLVDMIKEDLVAERIAIDSYREMIGYLDNNDPTTRRMLEGILAMEEEHVDDLVSLLEELGS